MRTRICEPVIAAKIASGSTAILRSSPYCIFRSSNDLVRASETSSSIGGVVSTCSSPFALAFRLALVCGAIQTSLVSPGGTVPTRIVGC